jgi:hypothetical protein
LLADVFEASYVPEKPGVWQAYDGARHPCVVDYETIREVPAGRCLRQSALL